MYNFFLIYVFFFIILFRQIYFILSFYSPNTLLHQDGESHSKIIKKASGSLIETSESHDHMCTASL